MSEFINNQKIDDETLETISALFKEINEDDIENEFLCSACGDLTQSDWESYEYKNFRHEFAIKYHFYLLKKNDASCYEERKEELEKLEQRALNEFETLSDFLHYNN